MKLSVPNDSRTMLDRRVVVEAAAMLADEDGIEAVTLAKLADRLGVRAPSLYNHIASLSALRHELAILGMRSLRDCVVSAAIGRNGIEAVLIVGDAYRAFANERPGLYAATLRAPDPTDRDLDAINVEFVEVFRKLLVPLGLGDELTVDAIRGISSIVHGFATLDVICLRELPQGFDESFHSVLRAMLEGFVSRARD